MKEPVYRPIIPEGTHLADSGKVPGAKLGAALDNTTNQVSGQADWVPVRQSPVANAIGYAILVAAGVVATVAVQKSTPVVQSWLQTTALPSAKAALRRITGTKGIDGQIDAVDATEPIQLSPAGFSKEIETALEGARRPMSSAEVKRRLLRIMLAAAIIAEEFRALDGIDIRDDEDLRELRRAMGKLTTQEVADLVNQIRVEDDGLLDAESEAAFVAAFVGDSTDKGDYLPIDQERLSEALRLPEHDPEDERNET